MSAEKASSGSGSGALGSEQKEADSAWGSAVQTVQETGVCAKAAAATTVERETEPGTK